MDDFQSAGYSTSDLQVLNNCCLYLRITTLAEMVDHTGQYIIPTAVLTSTKLPSRSQYSTSKYTWPNQLKPGRQAWTKWTRAIQSHYTKPGLSSHLIEPLGQWKSEANQTRTWHAHYDPTSQTVTVSLPGTPVHQYQPTNTTQNHTFYSLPTQSYTNNTVQTYPVTIEPLKKGFRIAIPRHSIPTPAAPARHQTPATLVGKIRKNLPIYATELWTNLNHNDDTLPTYLAMYLSQNNGQLTIVSDASLNNQNYSAFAWIIASPNIELWNGTGTVPCSPQDAHSGRAEGFGLLAAVTFLESYIQAFKSSVTLNQSTYTATISD